MAFLKSKLKNSLTTVLTEILKASSDGGGGGSSYLDSVVSSVCFDLDATISDSYSGSGQTWANLIASPADSAAQTDYDFHLGLTSSSEATDPTFNGSGQSAYWSFDGGDYFEIATDANTALLTDAHKTTGGGPITLLWAFQTPSSFSATAALFGTAGANGTDGFNVRITNTGLLQLLQFPGSGNNRTDLGTLSTSTDYIVALAFDYTAGTVKYALNATSFTSATLLSGAATANADFSANIASYGNGVLPQISGFRLYHTSIYNALLSDANLSDVVTHLETRHNRNYVP